MQQEDTTSQLSNFIRESWNCTNSLSKLRKISTNAVRSFLENMREFNKSRSDLLFYQLLDFRQVLAGSFFAGFDKVIHAVKFKPINTD